jgi:hypothetical protein
MSIVLLGSTSGSCTLQEQAVAGTSVLTLPVGTGTVVANNVNSAIVSMTAQASTSGTSIDFTGIPSWVKRVTVSVSGLSTNGASNYLIQSGSGSVENTGYLGASTTTAASASTSNYTTGFGIGNGGAAAGNTIHGIGTIVLINSSTNLWAFSFVGGNSDTTRAVFSGGSKAFSGTIDRVRITTVNGTDTFDAGTINILYE